MRYLLAAALLIVPGTVLADDPRGTLWEKTPDQFKVGDCLGLISLGCHHFRRKRLRQPT
jgi:hypothetical protein